VNDALSGFGILRTICALTSPLLLEIHKVFLQNSVIVRTQILSQAVLAEQVVAHVTGSVQCRDIPPD
jgi:hypothetical protein